ncbi:putative short-chain dehydrogenase/reductase family 42E member 2 [Rhinophrynus dorsalis]
MREKEAVCELEDLRSRVEMEDVCSACLQNNLQSNVPFRSATKHRSNGVVPHQSQASACSPSTHLDTVHTGITKALVTGGAGYVGHNLGCALIQSGVSVLLFDIHEPEWGVSSGAEFIQGDIRDYESLCAACDGVDCIFHMASYGMSGSQQLQKEQIESINIGGTKVVIDVCIQKNISKLIYTSTVNVVFGGNHIEDGDEETIPYFPLEKHMDIYSKTKAIADQMILAANGTPLKGGGKLHTCVLRPPGIYGPDERRHLPRLAVNVKNRLLFFKFGNHRTKMNWIHLHNLVEAHILAAEALTPRKGFIASGQAYYIHDGESVNLFEFLHPLFEKLGCSDPWITVPCCLVYAAAVISEYLHLALRPILDLNPVLTKNEVVKITVMHTFRIDKARKELGYNPKKFSFADAVDHYVKTRPKPEQSHAHFHKLVCIIDYCGSFIRYPIGSLEGEVRSA